MSDADCICKGNWRAIVKDYRPLYGRAMYRDGKTWTFYGVLDAEDDYYYVLADKDGKAFLASCVGALEKENGHGFLLEPPKEKV